jgi:8-oxo-dGTP pyrophosphatase MutT (NUDIX family)
MLEDANTAPPIELKVLAYLTRRSIDGLQLLVFAHLDYPEAGIQVPGGKVEAGESCEAALLREVLEESGVLLQAPGHRIAAYDNPEYNVRRYVFHVETVGLPDDWVHVVSGTGEDEGLRFGYYWLALEEARTALGWQGAFVSLLTSEQSAAPSPPC